MSLCLETWCTRLRIVLRRLVPWTRRHCRPSDNCESLSTVTWSITGSIKKTMMVGGLIPDFLVKIGSFPWRWGCVRVWIHVRIITTSRPGHKTFHTLRTVSMPFDLIFVLCSILIIPKFKKLYFKVKFWLINLILTFRDGKQSCCTAGLWFSNGVGWALCPAIAWGNWSVSAIYVIKQTNHQAVRSEEKPFFYQGERTGQRTRSYGSERDDFLKKLDMLLRRAQKVFSFVPSWPITN